MQKWIAAMLLVCAMCGSLHAASVKISVASQQGARKQDLVVPINLTGAQAVGAIEFDITYDPAVATATKVDKGPLASNTMFEASVTTPGRVRIAVVSQGGITGDGGLASIHFTAAHAKGSTPLSVENARAWIVPKGHEGMAGMQHLIDAQAIIEPGTLTVTGGMSMWMLVAGAFLVLLVLLIWMKSKRRGV